MSRLVHYLNYNIYVQHFTMGEMLECYGFYIQIQQKNIRTEMMKNVSIDFCTLNIGSVGTAFFGGNISDNLEGSNVRKYVNARNCGCPESMLL